MVLEPRSSPRHFGLHSMGVYISIVGEDISHVQLWDYGFIIAFGVLIAVWVLHSFFLFNLIELNLIFSSTSRTIQLFLVASDILTTFCIAHLQQSSRSPQKSSRNLRWRRMAKSNGVYFTAITVKVKVLITNNWSVSFLKMYQLGVC